MSHNNDPDIVTFCPDQDSLLLDREDDILEVHGGGGQHHRRVVHVNESLDMSDNEEDLDEIDGDENMDDSHLEECPLWPVPPPPHHNRLTHRPHHFTPPHRTHSQEDRQEPPHQNCKCCPNVCSKHCHCRLCCTCHASPLLPRTPSCPCVLEEDPLRNNLNIDASPRWCSSSTLLLRPPPRGHGHAHHHHHHHGGDSRGNTPKKSSKRRAPLLGQLPRPPPPPLCSRLRRPALMHSLSGGSAGSSSRGGGGGGGRGSGRHRGFDPLYDAVLS